MILILMLFIPTGMMAENTSMQNNSLIEITSEEALHSYIDNQTRWYQDLVSEYAPVRTETLNKDTMLPSQSVAASPSPVSKSGTGEATGYSTTNVQVAGVDEADYLKNDGKYLYIIHDGALVIAEVFPVESGRIISNTEIPGTASSLFLKGTNLVVFSSEYADIPIAQNGQYDETSYQHEVTHAYIYDVSDRTNPRITRELTLPGGYENGRMIGDVVYILTSESPSYHYPEMPVIYEGSAVITRPTIWCPPIPLYQYELYTLTSFGISEGKEVHASSFLAGWDSTLYVSPDNAYLAYQKWDPFWWSRVWDMSSSMRPDNGEESVIHRFSLSNGTITYQATGSFPGYLLNQFSLDEYGGNLRVATTDERYQNGEWTLDNAVLVLSPDLEIIGSLKQLAEGEKIYAARFTGDRLYLVTFKQTDPLFVVDLSNPEHPAILGALKIPGYSDYLHPYDSTHLIGIGKDTEETEPGRIVPTGVKIALFDVSDMDNPRLIDSRSIGEKGSSSEVLSDHKAFLFDQNRSMIVLPMREIVRVPVPGSTYENSYTTASWEGAYVFDVNPDTGFKERGKVEQEPITPDSFWSGSSVKRSVLMDSILYTISDNRIVGSDVGNLSSRLLIVKMPGTDTT